MPPEEPVMNAVLPLSKRCGSTLYGLELCTLMLRDVDGRDDNGRRGVTLVPPRNVGVIRNGEKADVNLDPNHTIIPIHRAVCGDRGIGS